MSRRKPVPQLGLMLTHGGSDTNDVALGPFALVVVHGHGIEADGQIVVVGPCTLGNFRIVGAAGVFRRVEIRKVARAS